MLLVAVAAGAMMIGPGMKLVEPLADGTPVVAIFDKAGIVQAHVGCVRWKQTDEHMMVRRFMASPTVRARVAAKNGKLQAPEDIDPDTLECFYVYR